MSLQCDDGYTSAGNDRCVPNNEKVPPGGKCSRDDGGPSPSAGDPVVLMDGAQVEQITDFATDDGLLSIVRYYRSAQKMFDTAVYNAPVLGTVGGWRFNFLRELQLNSWDASAATLFLPEGAAYDFVRSGNSFASSATIAPQTRYTISLIGTPPSDWSTLTSATSQWKVVDSKDRTTWTFATYASITHKFDVGRPISMAKPDGYTQTFSYDASGTLQTISDNRGRSLSVTWDTYAYPTGGSPSAPPTYTMLPVAVKTITLPIGGKLSYVNDLTSGPGGISGIEVPRILEVDQLNASGSIVDKVTYQYESTAYPKFLTGITNASGIRYVTIAYDANGRVISNGLAGGQNTYTFAYNTPSSSDPNTLTRTVTNPLGKQTVYTWSHSLDGYKTKLQSINGVASTNCPASASSYTYDTNGFVASETDAEGRVTAYVRDTRGRPTSITRGSGTPQAVTTTLTLDATFDIPTQIVAPGLTTTQTVTNGLVTAIQKTDTTTQSVPYSTNGQTRSWAFTYTGGLLTKVDGPLAGTGDSISYTYDTNGNIATFTNEMGKVTTVNAVNGFGQPTSVTDANGINSTLTYDYRGRLTGLSFDTANTPAIYSIAYNGLGDISSITDAINGSLTFAYDNARRLTSVTNSANEMITYTRDAMGHAASVSFASGADTAFSKTHTFDELGRLIKSVGAVASNSTYQFGYDKTDNWTSSTDPLSHTFSQGFDSLNRLISQTDEDSGIVTLTRNGIDAITSYKDPRNITSSYIRNGFGEIIQEISPDKGTTTYVRDARGLVTQRTDPRGFVTNYTYDNSGRLTGKSYPANPEYYASLTWDVLGGGNYGVGRLVGISDESGIDWRNFDSKGNIYAYYRTAYPLQSAVVSYYQYDAVGNIVGTNYPSGRWVGYQRDTLGRITNIVTYQTPTSQTGQTIASSITWNAYQSVKSLVHGNGLTESFTRDTDHRVTAVQVLVPNSTYDVNRSMTWMGQNLTSITDAMNAPWSQTFTYTNAHRLASANGAYGSLAWTYDAVNRTSETAGSTVSTYAYPSTSNRLTSVTPGTGTPRSFTYDAAGNIAADSRSGALGLTYQYDVEGRLQKTFQTNNTAEGATYTYDTQGRLSSRTVTHATAPTSTTTLYVQDLNDHIIAELNTSGQTLREYIWLNDIPVAVVENVLSGSPAIYYIHVDHLMRPVRATAQNWNWVWDVYYKPFGETSYLWSNPEVLDIRFPGQWFQLETGLAYNWHRHYDPTLGRYIQPDSLGLKALMRDGPSLYGYAAQAPLTWIDQNGQFAWLPFILAGGIAGLWPDTANSPGPDDPIFPNAPLDPYINGAIAGVAVCAPGAAYTPLFGRGGALNSNRYLRIGEGRKGGRNSFRAAGDIVEKLTGQQHIDFKDLGPWGK